jgi:signal transduction histidine kinase/chemotaxis methyl-accepting protein methylase/ActR/RegA family two-component response regulator
MTQTQRVTEPLFALALIIVGDEMSRLESLLLRLEPGAVSVIVWRPAAAPLEPMNDWLKDMTQPHFSVQVLADGDELEAGVIYVAPSQSHLWFDGARARVAAAKPDAVGPVDRFLVSFAAHWGRRSVAVMPQTLQGDGESGLAMLQSAGGTVLAPGALSAAADVPRRRLGPAPMRLAALANHSAFNRSAMLPRKPAFRVPRLFEFSHEALQALRGAVAASLERGRTRGRLRVWVPRCRTGTLVYAVAMLMCEAIADAGLELSLQIFGTDHDEEALAVARSGRYPVQTALGLDPSLRSRYTFDEGQSIRVAEALRELCVFSRHKLTYDAPLSRMDLLVCRRVLDRVGGPRRDQLLDGLAFSLRDGGLLVALDHKSAFRDERFVAAEEGYFRVRATRAKNLPPVPPFITALALAGPSGDGSPEPLIGDHARAWRRRELERAELIRTCAELAHFVQLVGVPLLLCDRRLSVLHMSAEARIGLGLSSADQGERLQALMSRMPGGIAVVHAAERALATQERQELVVRSGAQAYVVRISAGESRGVGGVAIVFSDVSALESARALAVTHQHQQAAIAHVAALAATNRPLSELFEEALDGLFGNIPVCAAGAILVRRSVGADLELTASRGLGSDALSSLQQLGAPGDLFQTLLERDRIVVQAPVKSASANLSFTSAIGCPICSGGEVVGVIALYARQPGLDLPDHQRFLQTTAHVLGGAVARQRMLRRLALEIDVSTALATGSDLNTLGGVERALRTVMPLERVELWISGAAGSGTWLRQFPDEPSETDLSFWPGELEQADTVHFEPACRERADLAELTIAVRSGRALAAVVRILGHRLCPPDPDLREGLHRVASMMADFLKRLNMLQALQRSESTYRQSSEQLQSSYSSLQRVEASLREADRQKDDFLAMLGHELRNPLAAMRNATDLLRPAAGASPALERLQTIFERQTQQMSKLIDGLLDVARVSHGKVDLQRTIVPLCELVRQVVGDRQHQLRDRRVELRLPERELWLAADRVRLVQIFDNLLTNACKFTLAGGRVSVEVSETSDGGALCVSDDGVGIDRDLLPSVFEPFRQGPGAGGHEQAGLGLGLALVKGLADLHGFRLQVKSEGRGRGAQFRLDFPLVEAPEAAPPESRVELKPLELLLVEDNRDIADTLAELLVTSGHRVSVVGTGEEAIDALRARRPEVVLCDIGLPGIDGLTLASLVRRDPALAHLKLVALTGFSDASTRERIEEAGFDRLLIKPVQLDTLRDCLARVTRSLNSR